MMRVGLGSIVVSPISVVLEHCTELHSTVLYNGRAIESADPASNSISAGSLAVNCHPVSQPWRIVRFLL